MRFCLALYCFMIAMGLSTAQAQYLIKPSQKPNEYQSPNLIPVEKPETRGFTRRSQNLISVDDVETIRPPKPPSQKTMIVSREGMPIPTRKPFRGGQAKPV